jgi:ergothioneine biosynthesis protein EgtB
MSSADLAGAPGHALAGTQGGPTHGGAIHDGTPLAVDLLGQYHEVRRASLALSAGWTPEDQALQSMPDASPVKWHLAHTSWFFEALLLRPSLPSYQAFDERYFRLFNSYYEALGPRHPRPQRGLLSRPDHAQVLAYRAHVDAAMSDLLEMADADLRARITPTLVLGLQHEMQHQELMVTDLLHAFSLNPLRPALWADVALAPAGPASHGSDVDPLHPSGWTPHAGGKVDVGHDGLGFAFDNELPRHPVWLQPYALGDRPVNGADVLAFIRDGGYRRPELWLSDAWATVQREGWQAPAYWVAGLDDDDYDVFGPNGLATLDPQAPVSALSYFEADAYARWAGARLPTEFEWEAAASLSGSLGGAGQVWEWTGSAYLPYPGFRPSPGPASEYNGKFMLNQMVLRGGSWATPAAQKRIGYRNFFPPGARWQISGLRLARDLE